MRIANILWNNSFSMPYISTTICTIGCVRSNYDVIILLNKEYYDFHFKHRSLYSVLYLLDHGFIRLHFSSALNVICCVWDRCWIHVINPDTWDRLSITRQQQANFPPIDEDVWGKALPINNTSCFQVPAHPSPSHLLLQLPRQPLVKLLLLFALIGILVLKRDIRFPAFQQGCSIFIVV